MYETEPQGAEPRASTEVSEPRQRRVNNDPRERPRVSPWVIALGSILILCALLTACSAAAAGAVQGILLMTSPARETITRQFPVGALPTVEVTVDAANIQITHGAPDQVVVTLTKETHAITQSLARQDLDAITLDTEQSGDLVAIRINSPDRPAVFGAAQRSISLLITVPPAANIDVTGGAGTLGINGVSGETTVHLSAGNVTMRAVSFSGSSSVRASAGNIEIQGALTPETNLEVSASAGNIDLTLPRSTRAHVEATATVGNLSISGFSQVSGQLNTRNVISADLNPNPQSVITAHVSVGNVSIRAGA
jgi:hypothetical protein